ncbi:MAG: hypothetical protein IKU54_03455 [Oscillospiraceae bacterium]|nr:hypothetical protein [Oscillospiraceae bacterium]
MKILFSVGEIEKSLNANTKIVLQIAEKLVQQGHKCIVAGVCSAFPGEEITDSGVVIKRLPAVIPVVKSSEKFENFVKNSADRNTARSRFVKKHPMASRFQFIRYTAFYREKIEQPRYLSQIKKVVEKYKPDGVVCVCKPINATETVVNGGLSVPLFIWQLDPWGLHRLDNPDGSMKIIDREINAFSKSEHVFTTPVLQRQYNDNDHYRGFTDKITAVEFPNIKEYIPSDSVPAVNFDGDYINLLFSGIVADQYRSPEYLLESMRPLFDAGEKIRIYFMGTNSSPVLTGFSALYPQNVIPVEKVDLDTAFATMEKADVLVNISNTVDNQVPSKIFDYFSMGKPVLNVQKIDNCPAQPYFDRYPLSFTLKENETADSDQIRQFLYNSKNNHLNFSQVEKIYSDATADSVASKIADNISVAILKGEN